MQKGSNYKNIVEEIYNNHFEKIYKFFYYRVLSADIAEDLTSNTFLTFAEIVRGDKVQIQNHDKIIYGIAKNIFLQYLKQKYKSEIPFSVIGDNFEEYVSEEIKSIEDKPTLEERAIKYINLLPIKQKEVAYLRLIEKMSLKAIAVKLKKNLNYVKVTQRRALKSLKVLVETVL